MNKKNLTLVNLVMAGALLFNANKSHGQQVKSDYKCGNSAFFSYVADTIGNRNGKAENEEKDYVLGLLASADSNEFYMITQSPESHFKLWDGILKAYESKKELEDNYRNKGVRGSVGILKIDKCGNVLGAWSSGGSDISGGKWTEERIPEEENFLKLLLMNYNNH